MADEQLERIERLLAALLVHQLRDESQVDKALALSRAGLKTSEIAELLGANAASLSTQISRARNGTGKKKTSRKRTRTSSRR